MPIKKVKPTSAGRRFITFADEINRHIADPSAPSRPPSQALP